MIAGRGSLHAGDQLLAALRQSQLTVTALRIKDVTGALRARHYLKAQRVWQIWGCQFALRSRGCNDLAGPLRLQVRVDGI